MITQIKTRYPFGQGTERVKARRLIRKLRSSHFGRHVAVVASGTALAQLIPVILTPVLTRLYDPIDMGMLGLYTSFISFLSGALTLGYGQAIVTGRHDEEGADLAVIAIGMIVPVSIIGAMILLALSQLDLLGFSELPPWTAGAMTISLILTGVYFALRAWLVRIGQFPEIARATVLQSAGRISTQIATGLLGFQWVGLVLGEIVGRGMGLRRMLKSAVPSGADALGSFDWQRFREVATRYRKFPLISMPSSLLNSASLVLPIPLITMYFGVSAAGQFAIASRIMMLPLSFIGNSVGDVFHSRIAQVSRESPESAMRLFLMVAAALAAIGMIPAVIITIWGGRLFELALGSQWTLAGSISAAIVPWVFMQLTVNPVSRVVLVYQGQELKLVYDVLSLVSIIGILTLGYRLNWTVVETSHLLGWTQALVYGIYLIVLVRILRVYRDINFLGGEGAENVTESPDRT